MATKKTAELSSSLVAVKGAAIAPPDVVTRQAAPPAAPAAQEGRATVTPLNFKVDAAFRRRFRQRAADADLKLNELLREALEAWEQKRGLRH